jgi:IS605 OrfB family transposase
MAIPVRCDKPGHRRLERSGNGDTELDLMICRRPYPRVLLATGTLGPGQRDILDRLLANGNNARGGYRQRLFEIKQDSQTHKWWLYVTYELPAPAPAVARPDVIVGVDLGVSVPLYAAINNGLARLGRRQFQSLGHRIHTLQNQVIMRRRAIQRGGRAGISQPTARSGHGVHRKLLPTERLRRRIDKSYTTLNHQLSAAVIDFARNHGAGVIQMEDLSSLKETLVGTFLGARWRYHQLEQFLKYKAEENGIIFQEVNPKYTSRRCSECGFIHAAFDRAFRDRNRAGGMVARFECPECGYKADPDYNAARNIATLDIERVIELQCKKQNLG